MWALTASLPSQCPRTIMNRREFATPSPPSCFLLVAILATQCGCPRSHPSRAKPPWHGRPTELACHAREDRWYKIVAPFRQPEVAMLDHHHRRVPPSTSRESHPTVAHPRSLASLTTTRQQRQLSIVAWTPADDIDRIAWVRAGMRLGTLSRSSNWWVGDWLRYGNEKWGEKYTAAARITGYDPHSLENMAYVAGRFEISLRRENLSWSHHFVVAALEPAAQSHWLDLATTQGLSVSDLRIEVRAANRRAAGTAARGDVARSREGQHHLVCPQCGFRLTQSKSLAHSYSP